MRLYDYAIVQSHGRKVAQSQTFSAMLLYYLGNVRIIAVNFADQMPLSV